MKNVTLTVNSWLDVITNITIKDNDLLLIKLIQKTLRNINHKKGFKDWSTTAVNINLTPEQYEKVLGAMPVPKVVKEPHQTRIVFPPYPKAN